MKKLVLLISAIMMTSAILFAQNNCTLQIDSYDLTGVSAGEVINVPVRMVSVDDVVMGWEFYILFDPTYLTPTATFLQNKNPLFPGNWFENIVGGNQFAANWLDATFAGVTVPDDEVLFELQFTYEGGLMAGDVSDMVWNFAKKTSDNFQVKGVTAVVNGSFAFFDITPIDGGVFLPAAAFARVQAIHNSADAAAAVVDVWLDDTKIIDDFAFRTASPFIDAPADVEFTLVIADPASTDPNSPIWSQTYTLAADETYVLVANGIVSASGYTPSTPFDIYVYPMGQEAAVNPTDVDVLAFHGSTDAPIVDVYEVGVGAGLLIDDLAYGNFAGYLPLAVDDYLISVRDETGTATVAIYSAPLATLGLGGEAAVICASGFLDPSVNSGGPGFGLWVALPAGGALVELPLYTMRAWDGTESTDWFDPLNWDVEAVPGPGDDAMIPNGLVNYPTITGGVAVAVCNNLDIADAASVTLLPDGFMSVLGTSTNDGFLGTLGDVPSSGSFICTDIQGIGSYQYWRTLEVTPQADPEQEGWHYISSPTQGFSSYNMYDYYINTWDEATANWVNNGSNTPCVPAAEIFNDGMYGWSVKWDDMYSTYGCPNPGTGDVVEFIGPYNAGDQMGMATYTGTGSFTGFNLIGNPYPSWWDYDEFYFGANWPATGLNDAIYFWDESMNQYASYVFGVSNNGGSPFVPPTQSFFFELDGSEANVNLTFTPNEQAHVVGQDFWKSESIDIVRLEVSGNGYVDQTTIKFNENATVNRDKIDARKLHSGGQMIPSLWTLGGDVQLSINQMPAADEVPVYFDCQTTGTYSIEAVETSDYSILILEDKFTGEETDLLSSGYSFEHTSGANTDRFVLHYKTTGIGDNTLSNVSIWSGNQKIFVRTDVTAKGDITVYNMMGQEIVRTDIEPGLNTIPMYDVNTYYVVKVTTSKGVETGKVFIK
jgi:hypothetical protein